MKTRAIVLMLMAVLVWVGCQAGQPKGADPAKSDSGIAMPLEELAADRPVPRRTNARRRTTTAPKPAEAAAAPESPATRPAAPDKAEAEPEATAPERKAAPPEAKAPTTAPTPTVAPKPASEESGAMVLVPSQGRPVMVTPGDTFYFVIRLRKALGQRIYIWLVHSRVPELRFGLRSDVKLGIVHGRYGQMILKVPDTVPPGLYDLEIEGESRSYFSRHGIRILEGQPDRFRFVHLSDMNIGDPSAPEFDERLVEEINLLAPAFVVCTGDFTQWGRALDQPEDWTRVLEFLARIQSPTYIVCGDRDHEASFERYVADNPIGTFDYGNYHGILMLDHAASPLSVEQVAWLKTELANNQNLRGFNFIVTHSNSLELLDKLRRDVPDLPAFVKRHKLRMIITGGHEDWDFEEYADKLKGLQGKDGLAYIRTHEASTCMQGRATGVSHFRVCEVDGRNVRYVYPDDVASRRAQHSIPVGKLRVFHAHPNDGTQGRVVATVQNALNQRFDDCRVWLRVAKGGEPQPAVAGGELVRVLDGKTYWMCEIRVDLPDKGGVKVMAANDSTLLPDPVPVTVRLDAGVPTTTTTRPATRAERIRLTFEARRGEHGKHYVTCDRPLALDLKNTSGAEQKVWPVVRVDGLVLPLDIESVPGRRRPLTIEPGKSLRVPLKLTVEGDISPGPHDLQIFFRSDPLKRLTIVPVGLDVRS